MPDSERHQPLARSALEHPAVGVQLNSAWVRGRPPYDPNPRAQGLSARIQPQDLTGEDAMSQTLKLGKAPARPGAVKLELARFLPTLPPVPKTFGHQTLMHGDVGMLGNDQYGDCVWAGAAHETILWNREAGRDSTFTDRNVLSDYSAVTGFRPTDPSTDQGTDMATAASYRRHTGVVDALGNRHMIAAYLALKPGNVQQIAAATYLFGAVGIGIQFPASAMAQFNAGKPWTVVSRSRIEGGHYIPIVGRDATYFYAITWGRLQKVTPGFLAKYSDEGIAYLSHEFLNGDQTSPEGFKLGDLQKDLSAL